MKQLGVFTQDGFKGSIELLKFIREMNNDIAVILSAIVGTSTVFIKGGVISQSGGSTTITDGIIFKDGKFYYFTGSTAVGTPATLKVLFTTTTAAGYPLPTYVGNPIGADIYLENSAKIDATGAIFLNQITQSQNLQSLNALIASTVATINIALDTKVDKGIVWQTGTGTAAAGMATVESSRPYGRWCKHPSGVIYVELALRATSNIAANTRLFECIGLKLQNYVWQKYMPCTIKQNGVGINLGHLQFSTSATYDILGDPSSGQRMDIITLSAIPAGYQILQTFVLIP